MIFEWHPCRWMFQSQWQIKLPWQLMKEEWHNLRGQFCLNIQGIFWNFENFSLYNQHRENARFCDLNLHKSLLILAYIDKTYKNHLIMFSGSDSSNPMMGANMSKNTHKFRWKSAVVTTSLITYSTPLEDVEDRMSWQEKCVPWHPLSKYKSQKFENPKIICTRTMDN